jgi:purine-binding chemotaxis protein CheW
MNDFVRKPLKPAHIRELLDGVRAADPEQPEEQTPPEPVETAPGDPEETAAPDPVAPEASEAVAEEDRDGPSSPEEKSPERILRALDEADARRKPGEDTGPVRHLMVFSLGDEKYALDVRHLKNVMWAGRVTPVPDMPPHVLGIMNIRGEIISVVDLKQLLGLDTAPASPGSVMVTSERGVDVGFLVDSLDEIVDLPADRIDPPMITFEKECAEFIDGEAQVGGRLMAVLNYARIMGSRQMSLGSDPWMERQGA